VATTTWADLPQGQKTKFESCVTDVVKITETGLKICPAGAREATFFHPPLIEHCIRYGEYIEADLRNQIRFRELAQAM
jgi:hypothetical protein